MPRLYIQGITMLHNRQSTRLKEYDYSKPGAYFVTICTFKRQRIFGNIVDCKMHLNDFGKIVEKCWHYLPNHYPNLKLDYFVIMPNHVHCIINIIYVGAGLKPAPTMLKNHGLSEITRALKTFSSRRINKLRETAGNPLWQRNYYDHVIRHEKELNKTREYIVNNPAKWPEDRNNPLNM